MTVRLDPAELGQIQVRITRAQDGAASVIVAVERPETLRNLQADLSHLHQALDRAGVPEQRSLLLHLAPPELGLATSSGGDQSGAHAGPHHRQAQPHLSISAGLEPSGRENIHGSQPATARWRRAGVNITA